MDCTGCDVVEVVPGKVSGAPILKDSRVTADAVWESYELGESVEEIAYSFSLDLEDIRIFFVRGVPPSQANCELMLHYLRHDSNRYAYRYS